MRVSTNLLAVMAGETDRVSGVSFDPALDTSGPPALVPSFLDAVDADGDPRWQEDLKERGEPHHVAAAGLQVNMGQAIL
jgi:hypothetical protein